MSKEWPIAEVVSTEMEARMIEGFLESRGVECQIESLRFHQEPVNLGRLSEVRVRVRTEDLERARALLEELRRSPPMLEEGAEGGDGK
ncbi:MAG: DUF2007 domain-containing protein [Acidobacteriota bacterium]|nr:DUF2007 domain-containing protein [Acidobacteriota bacterium]